MIAKYLKITFIERTYIYMYMYMLIKMYNLSTKMRSI